MAPTVLQTKLFAPVPDPDAVPRTHLLTQIEQAQGCRLVLVSAPAGSGKTALIASWLKDAGLGAGWVSLDDQDNDEQRFLLYVVSALSGLHQGIGERALSLLQTTPPPPATTVAEVLINDLVARVDAGVLVLDDYHVITSRAIHEVTTLLLERLPTGFTLVIIARSDPPLPLSRLRSRGQLCEIRAADLRFDREEAATLVERVCGRSLAGETMTALTRRTEGWAAGLQLAGLALRKATDADAFITRFTGTHAFIADYLADEVLDGLPPEHQEFLIRTSIFPRFNGALCDAALERAGSHGLLEELARANLFLIPLDESRSWYRYHHLFADLLRRRCRSRFAEELSDMLGRASRWCEDAGLWSEAVTYAREAGDKERVATLIARCGLWGLAAGDVGTVTRWLEDLPPGTVESSPDLCVIAAWTSNLFQQQDRFTAYARRAEVLLDEGIRPHPEVEVLEGHLALQLAGVEFLSGAPLESVEGRIREARDHLRPCDLLLLSVLETMTGHIRRVQGRYEEALEAYHASNRASASAEVFLMELLASLATAEVLLMQGKLREALTCCTSTLDHLRARVGESMGVEVGILHGLIALIQYEQNDVEAASRSLERALAIFEAVADSGEATFSMSALARTPPSVLHSTATGIFFSLFALVRLLIHRGEFAEAAARLDEAEIQLDKSVQSVGHIVIDALRVRLWVAQRHHAAIAGWLRVAPALRSNHAYWREVASITRARAALAVGQYEEALATLGEAIPALEQAVAIKGMIEALVLQGQARAAVGKASDALSSIHRALELSATRGFGRVWIEEGEGILPLLQQCVAEGACSAVASAHASHLILEIQREVASGSSVLPEPLSERELEVLRLLAAGHPNRIIAEQLFLAIGTVKKHTHTIYQKLEVKNRTQAVRRAQELHLL